MVGRISYAFLLFIVVSAMSSDEDYKDEESSDEEEEDDEEEWVEDADEDEVKVNHRKFGKDLSNKRKRAPAQKKNQPKRKGRSSCRAKKGCGDDDDGGSLENFLIVEKREGEKPQSNIILLGEEDIFTKYDSFIVGENDKREEARLVLRHLVENGLRISDPDLGDGSFVQEGVTSMLQSGLLTTKHEPMDNHRSPWFGSAYRNNPHNMKILQASTLCMTFLRNALEDTGGIIYVIFSHNTSLRNPTPAVILGFTRISLLGINTVSCSLSATPKRARG